MDSVESGPGDSFILTIFHGSGNSSGIITRAGIDRGKIRHTDVGGGGSGGGGGVPTSRTVNFRPNDE